MYKLTKRIFDLALALPALLLFSPLLLLVALCIKLDSPGPVLYRGKRTAQGEGNQFFYIFKFRSMVHDAESKGGFFYCLK